MYEFDQTIKKAIREFINTPRKEKRLIGGEYEISQLTAFAVLANYSTSAVGPELVEKILNVWKSLRRRLRYVVWLSTWKSLKERVFSLGVKSEKDELVTNGVVDG